jgi:hypothetical protein
LRRALAREEDLGNGSVTSRKKRLDRGFTAYDRNFDINVGRTISEDILNLGKLN